MCFSMGLISMYCAALPNTIFIASFWNIRGCFCSSSNNKNNRNDIDNIVLSPPQITAAAGGTGQFAVQIAANMGCHVIGTCSSEEKVAFLKSIGCTRAINYKAENLDEVLTKEYPKGYVALA